MIPLSTRLAREPPNVNGGENNMVNESNAALNNSRNVPFWQHRTPPDVAGNAPFVAPEGANP